MSSKDDITHRLALLQGVKLSAADLEAITTEIQDLERIVAELEEFAGDTPWVSLQAQPIDKLRR